MGLEGIIRSEISQTERQILYVINVYINVYKCGIFKKSQIFIETKSESGCQGLWNGEKRERLVKRPAIR